MHTYIHIYCLSETVTGTTLLSFQGSRTGWSRALRGSKRVMLTSAIEGVQPGVLLARSKQ